MKKLTAGIFTVILGLTTVDAFAAIPTQAYVDSAVEYALDQAKAAVYNDTAIKADIAANATAVQSAAAVAAAAQTAAAAAQGDVDTLSGKVGTVPADKTVVQMISEAQSSATYDDTGVKADIKANTDAISAMDTAYKAADTALDGKITTNANAISAMDTAYKAADTALDGKITTNANAISAMDTAYKAADTNLQGQIDALEANAYNDTEVRGLITAAQAQADKGVADAAEAQTQADKGVADAAAAAAAAAAAQATADSKLAVTGSCPTGETCYLDSTGAIQVAVKTYVKPTAQPTQQ